LDAGQPLKTESVTLVQDALPARYLATFASGGTCLASLDEDRLSIFRGATSYVGRVSRDGKRIDGTVFSGRTRHRFVAGRSD
jgi:hypothetical protein